METTADLMGAAGLSQSHRSVGRVLMTADAVGGVWQYAIDLSATLANGGIEVLLATMGPPPSADQRRDASALGLRLVERPCRLEWMDDPWADVEAAGGWLLALERAFAPDVVHLNGYCHAPLPWRAPVIVAGHSCVRSWWRAVHGTNAPASWSRYSEAVGRGLRAARLVVAPTRAMLRALQEEYGAFGEARVIPNARATGGEGFAHMAAKSPIVFAAGRLWDQAKNIDALCDAAPQLAWPVYVAGDHGSAPIEALAPVHHLGRLSAQAIAGWYTRAAIYALPARYEPFGLSVLEAARAGCALVLGDIASLRENWEGAAVFVDPDDRSALARAISELIAEPVRRAELGCLASVRARQFNIGDMAGAYAGAYGAALPQPGQ